MAVLVLDARHQPLGMFSAPSWPVPSHAGARHSQKTATNLLGGLNLLNGAPKLVNLLIGVIEAC